MMSIGIFPLPNEAAAVGRPTRFDNMEDRFALYLMGCRASLEAKSFASNLKFCQKQNDPQTSNPSITLDLMDIFHIS
jgi:hypothetical protein